MRQTYLLLTAILLILSCQPKQSLDKSSGTEAVSTKDKPQYALVIHGGAGSIKPGQLTPEKENEMEAVLHDALDTGQKILAAGGSSIDAVVETIKKMEDHPMFNAGKGAVFTNAGHNELDASIMIGSDLNAGAVGGVKTVKNPITAARAVLEKSEHVLLVGEGADIFSKEQGLELVDNEYFKTERKWKSLQKVLDKEKDTGSLITELSENKYGTVGAVALDMSGNIVAGTSTGGMTNKRYNRIGDSPIIGAGTYANNKTCGVSCTGHGEYFMRYAVAYDLSAMMEYKGSTLEKAADHIIHEKLMEAGGSGGLIAIDHQGNIVMPFNTQGMYRGYVTDSDRYIAMYRDDNK